MYVYFNNFNDILNNNEHLLIKCELMLLNSYCCITDGKQDDKLHNCRTMFGAHTTKTHENAPISFAASMYPSPVLVYYCLVGGGVQTGSTRHVGHLLAYCTCPGWLWRWRIWWNEWQGKPKYSEKTYPRATLSTTNPIWPDPGLNPGRRGGKPATNRFSYGAASVLV
jgi:hypothetical protein